jgi:NDP-sugar pyrophosphorylase family protein
MKQLANNKIEAIIITTRLRIERLERDFRNELFGGVDIDEMKIVIDGLKKDLKIWEYIKNKIQ